MVSANYLSCLSYIAFASLTYFQLWCISWWESSIVGGCKCDCCFWSWSCYCHCHKSALGCKDKISGYLFESISYFMTYWCQICNFFAHQVSFFFRNRAPWFLSIEIWEKWYYASISSFEFLAWTFICFFLDRHKEWKRVSILTRVLYQLWS